MTMSLYIVDINASGINPEEMAGLREREGVVMEQYGRAGLLKNAYVKKDLSGAYLIFEARDLAHVNELVAGLPMFPYMTLQITELLMGH